LQVEQCAQKAMALSDRLPETASRFAAHRLAWNSCLMRQPVPRAVTLARNLVELAEQDRTPAKLAVAQRALGYSLLIAGEFQPATTILAHGAALADAISDSEFAIYGEHPGIVCRMYGGQTKTIAGFPTSGVQLLEAAVACARRGGNAHSLAWATALAAHVFQIQREPEATIRYASEAIEVAREHHLQQWLALCERCVGWAMHKLGDPDAGMNLMMLGVKRWNDTGAMLHTTHCGIVLAEAFLQQGQTPEARAHLDIARAHCSSYGEDYLAAEIHRLEGLLRHHAQDAIECVEECLNRSLQTARRQGARLFELRTATAFARLLAERGERRRAADLLAPVYAVFTEGFEFADLQEAKVVLDTVG
jgi:tetratricopeptide (TPR) repeat protein